MYRLTSDPSTIFNTATGEFFSVDDENTSCIAYKYWLADGNVAQPILASPPPYELYTPAHFRAVRAAAWEWMTGIVRERQYDSIETCVGYYNSGVARYRSEARAMVAWRDAVNQKLEELVATLPLGIETFEQAKVLLPQPEDFDWPEKVDLPLNGAVAPVEL